MVFPVFWRGLRKSEDLWHCWIYVLFSFIFTFYSSFTFSPSGCTFWGKKPWSRKKKILWQLGTLVGAPVGIALIAGIAIPAMIIGIPVYVGRKVGFWKNIDLLELGVLSDITLAHSVSQFFFWQNCAVKVMRAEGFYCLSWIYQFIISPCFLTHLTMLFTSVSQGYIAIHSLSVSCRNKHSLSPEPSPVSISK